MVKQNIYQDNVLNKYDNYTYNWTMYMLHPNNAHKFEENIAANNVKIIAQSGVESEINIQSVQQSLVVAFKANQDRSSMANMFGIRLVEPGGATLFTRILEAAGQLEIENHLAACYLMELKFYGYDQNGTPTIVQDAGPYYYMCTMVSLNFNYADGATNYAADLMETHQDAYKTQYLHLHKKTDDITASNFGEFLEKLEKTVNKQEIDSTIASPSKYIPNTYKLQVEDSTQDWKSLVFGDSATSGDQSKNSVSVTGNGTLTFSFDKGSSVSDAMVVALLHTVHFRKLPTAEGGFHKEDGNDAVALPKTFKELSQWFIFNNEVRYGEYDYLQKAYARKITYGLHKFVVPELIHDAPSFLTQLRSSSDQKTRLSNIVQNGLLRKRFDYTHTGVNTEVLNLDISLNNTYYQLQAINTGLISARGRETISGLPGHNDNRALTQATAQEITNKIRAKNQKSASITKQISSIKGGAGNPDFERRQGGSGKIVQLAEEQKQIAEEIKKLKTEAEAANALARQAIKDLAQNETRQIAPVTDRYITQSELIGSNKRANQTNDLPVSFMPLPINSKANAGPDTGDNAAATMLGAVELNLNTMGDLVQQQIQVRGDPYWLGKPKGSHAVLQKTNNETGRAGANYQTGGCSYFLNVNFATYPEQQTGLMNIPEANFGIVGLYRVFRVDANYQDGQFTMTLDAYRDMNTNIGLVWDEVTSGEINVDSIRTEESFKTQQPDDIDDAFDPPVTQPGDDLGTLIDGDTLGSVTEAQSSATTRVQPIASDLKAILQQAATASGLDVSVYSGGQPDIATGGRRTGSTRHDNGHAADVRLRDSSGRNLSLDNPADVPLIQNFLAEAKRAGATGIGAGNGYMGNNGFHIDNAAKYGQANPNATYWGGLEDNGTFRAKNAPQWLKTIMTG